jgi:hypothetical protein
MPPARQPRTAELIALLARRESEENDREASTASGTLGTLATGARVTVTPRERSASAALRALARTVPIAVCSGALAAGVPTR